MLLDESQEPRRRAVGAYGLRLEGVSEPMRAFLGRAGPRWPELRLRAGVSTAEAADVSFSDEAARVPLPGGGEIVVQRSPLVAEARLPNRPRDAELLHPYLGYAAVVVARWLGRDCVHAGVFVVDGLAWALVGERGSGKSSLLGWLAAAGYDVVCDDVLVVEDGSAFAGPRFVDLRAEAAERIGAGEPVGMVGTRERWRLRVGEIEPELPLGGWIFLDWGSHIEVQRVGPAESIVRIKNQLSLFTSPRDPGALLDLASLRSWRLARPRSWESMPRALELLVDELRR